MIATIISILGFILFLPFAVHDSYQFNFSNMNFVDWILVAYFGLAVTAGAFWLFYAGLSKVSATVAGSFMAFMPLSAVFFSALLLGEKIYAQHLIAGICVIGGIMLTTVKNPKEIVKLSSETQSFISKGLDLE